MGEDRDIVGREFVPKGQRLRVVREFDRHGRAFIEVDGGVGPPDAWAKATFLERFEAVEVMGDETRCSTPSPATVVPPDRETWDILCAYLAGEELHGSEISEGRLAEILRHRIGWSRDEVRAAWFDAVARGNALIEADHERMRLLREARVRAEIERRGSGGAPTAGDCSS